MESSTTTKRIAFVQACWHREVVDEGRDSFVAEIERHGVSADQIDMYEVPGSLEIPLQAKLLAKTGAYSTIVAAGFVVNGGIYRAQLRAPTRLGRLLRVQLVTAEPLVS